MRRLSALVLVLVFGGTPFVQAVCQTFCEEAAVAATADEHHHACAEMRGDSSASSIHGVPHVCGHLTDEELAVQQALQLLDSPLAVATEIVPVPRPLSGRLARHDAPDSSPPGLLARQSQLRI